MTNPDEVARALSRLATGAPPISEQHVPSASQCPTNPEHVVADAEAAMEQVDRAAAFLATGGESRLRTAIQTASANNDDALAARGRAVASTLAAFRAAAADDSQQANCSASVGRTTSTALAQRSSGEGA